MGINLSDLNSSNGNSSSRRKRKAVVNLAKEYSNEEPEVFKVSPEVKLEASMKAQQKKLDSSIKKMEKVIQVTDKAILKSKLKLSDTIVLAKFHSRVSLANPASFTVNPNHLDFLSNIGNPKRVLNYIIMNLDSNGYFSSTSDNFLEGVELKNDALKKSLHRLEKRGFIKIHSVRGISHRRILVNPSILSL